MNPCVFDDATVTMGFLPSGFEWVVIMLALLLLFGKRLPEVMRGLGSSVNEFKRGMEDPAVPTVRTALPVDAERPSPPPVAPPVAPAPSALTGANGSPTSPKSSESPH